MTELYGRSATITVGTLRLTSGDVTQGLRVAFSCSASLKPEPNKATVAIYNLNETHRGMLETLNDVPVEISAGYLTTGESTIFRGLLSKAQSISDNVDTITYLETGDGAKNTQTRQVNLSFPPGTPTAVAIKQLAKALGVSPGNLDAQVYTFIGGGSVLERGAVIAGPASVELAKLMRATDKEWSIQQGAIQVLVRDQWLQGTAVVLTSSTGLIGSPEVDSKGMLRCSALMQPDIFPGRQLVLQSKHVSGAFRIEATTHNGDTHADEWIVNIEAKAIP